ncbi:hypothetical protein ACOBQX_17070 [Actinokineospora sp. G85]|uniref:hypothetical protein n=1 Tax=Actinokineospora sp. G85 TaxID=3406626 RepID=UPI003C76311A
MGRGLALAVVSRVSWQVGRELALVVGRRAGLPVGSRLGRRERALVVGAVASRAR